jgi:hypothetical protein
MTEPATAPALTVLELFEQLRKKGYKPTRECYEHEELGHCCATALWEFRDDFFKHDSPDGEGWRDLWESRMKSFLELDRREVFRVWYGEAEVWDTEVFGSGARVPRAELELLQATYTYYDKVYDTCIDYLLQNP